MRALYDYKSTEEGDLCFAVNDVIGVISTDDPGGGWWSGVMQVCLFDGAQLRKTIVLLPVLIRQFYRATAVAASSRECFPATSWKPLVKQEAPRTLVLGPYRQRLQAQWEQPVRLQRWCDCCMCLPYKACAIADAQCKQGGIFLGRNRIHAAVRAQLSTNHFPPLRCRSTSSCRYHIRRLVFTCPSSSAANG